MKSRARQSRGKFLTLGKDLLLRPCRPDPPQRLLRWRPQIVQNLVELVNIVFTLEDRLVAEELSEDAPDGPSID